jgi:hypothetical protein
MKHLQHKSEIVKTLAKHEESTCAAIAEHMQHPNEILAT